MPLSPQDIKPAIPRQKVSNKDGRIGEVILLECILGVYYLETLVNDEETGEKYFESFPLKECKLLPEEPRDFKVGDKVVHEYENGNKMFDIIQTMEFCGKGERITQSGQVGIGGICCVRHATPLEISKYFN